MRRLSHSYFVSLHIMYLVFHASSFHDRKGNGTPLQHSCLENPWTEEPGRLQSMRSLRIGHDWSDLVAAAASADVFLELSCFFNDPVDVGNLISGSSALSKSNLNIWKFMDHVLLKPGLESFQHYFASMWDECNCAVVWTFFGTAFLWDWKEKWPFPVLWPLLSFPDLLAYWV